MKINAKYKHIVLRLTTILLFTVLLNSCVFLLQPYRHKYKKDSICSYDNLTGGIDSLIDINGFYSLYTFDTGSHFNTSSFVFYNDGTFSIVPWSDDLPIYSNVSNIDISEHINKYKKNVFSFRKYDLLGGMYIMKEDTIVCEYVEPEFFEGTYKLRYTFKVVDRQTIKFLFSEELNRNNYYFFDHDNDNTLRLLWKFYPGINKPDSLNTYDKNLKYRWSSVKKWREYKRELKKHKRIIEK